MFRSVLRSKVLSIRTRAKILETFVKPALYGLSTIVCFKADNDKLKVAQNTAR
ncbi:unnamed protein product [Hymenolepis diminuta]|uniref:Uncharacterized protein n=1 Tax=Hymenolepis diminuta TaxID=6216 RepID=A0A564Y2P2_HYMDI|nr:unnamed protein product [Hymenolepis diminuta]